MGFYEYNADESLRRGYCYWQVPLHWLTLGLWYVVPTDYPCNVGKVGGQKTSTTASAA